MLAGTGPSLYLVCPSLQHSYLITRRLIVQQSRSLKAAIKTTGMKTTLMGLLLMLATLPSIAQVENEFTAKAATPFTAIKNLRLPGNKEIRISEGKWRITRNHIQTGGLIFLAGLTKGFNETLQFHWKEFHRQFPKAGAQWFNPDVSWKNKYKNNDPEQGSKYFLSTSLLIAFTDQYHLNNFVNRLSWGGALVIKIGEGKKPFKKYLLDFLYYAACHQAGFALS